VTGRLLLLAGQDVEFGQQVLHPAFDLVADRPDGVDALSGRVVQRPLRSALLNSSPLAAVCVSLAASSLSLPQPLTASSPAETATTAQSLFIIMGISCRKSLPGQR